MATQLVNFKWAQGEDLSINLIYKEGSSTAKAAVVNLSTGYTLRMDLVIPGTKQVVYSYLSTNQTPTALTSGKNGPNINILLPRALTLQGGPLYERIESGSGGPLSYDIFLRNNTTNRQVRILRGSISIERSHTLWP